MLAANKSAMVSKMDRNPSWSFLHSKGPHMKFCKYSTGDFVMRHKTIDKSLYDLNLLLKEILRLSASRRVIKSAHLKCLSKAGSPHITAPAFK